MKGSNFGRCFDKPIKITIIKNSFLFLMIGFIFRKSKKSAFWSLL